MHLKQPGARSPKEPRLSEVRPPRRPTEANPIRLKSPECLAVGYSLAPLSRSSIGVQDRSLFVVGWRPRVASEEPQPTEWASLSVASEQKPANPRLEETAPQEGTRG